VPKPEPAPASELEHRLEQTRNELDRQDVDFLLVGPSTDLVYLVDFGVRQSERLTILVVARDGPVRLVMPSFELPRIEGLRVSVEPAPWADGSDPVDTLATLLPDNGSGTKVAIGPQLFSHFAFAIKRKIPNATYLDGSSLLEPVRMRKSSWEIDQLRAASHAADATFEELITDDLRGKTEADVLARIHSLLIEHGHELVGRGIVGVNGNGASPHHKAGDTLITEGSAVVVDFGGALNNYRSDITRTFCVGEPPPEFTEVYEVVDQANQRAFDFVKPGVRAEDVDNVARSYIEQAGYGDAFLHRLGHGIGLDGHEPPYLVRGSDTHLEEGFAFSVEPGVYLKGRFGVRIEDIAIVTATGAERLNESTHKLQIV
jgi:Xaa-Pro aminopeptidase